MSEHIDGGSAPEAPDETNPSTIEAEDITDDIESPAPKKRRGLALVTPILGLVALAGAAVFAATSLSGNSSGGRDPEAAVRSLLDAISNEDVLGVLSNLLSSERDALRRPLTDISSELQRLDILKQGFDLSSITGVDVEFEGLALRTETIADGYALVQATGGRVRYEVDKRALPIGAVVRDTADESLFGPKTTGSRALEPDDISIVAVRDGGRWYASMWYSFAESARRDAGAPKPDFGKRLQARGAASPEGAVRGLVEAAAKLDFRALFELFDPQDARALHDYAPLFLADANAITLSLLENVSVKVTKLDLESDVSGDQALVRITGIAFTAKAIDGSFSATFDGDCFTSKGLEAYSDTLPARVCKGDLLPKGSAPRTRTAKLGFVVVDRNGSWYLSPTRTMLGGLTAMLKSLDPKDIEDFRDLIGRFASAA